MLVHVYQDITDNDIAFWICLNRTEAHFVLRTSLIYLAVFFQKFDFLLSLNKLNFKYYHIVMF